MILRMKGGEEGNQGSRSADGGGDTGKSALSNKFGGGRREGTKVVGVTMYGERAKKWERIGRMG